ncbi:hypothetical protein CYD53_12926 [Bosea psychrotolerans]|uniref:Uncharacterized protein n=1 Tax=Bosea psychrotolerans TaxID=1871628 RepID=A0A2S4LTU3_9HYPH|nr:hypothetical protein CYD53_12926 [Bosea psychrotolerans]
MSGATKAICAVRLNGLASAARLPLILTLF